MSIKLNLNVFLFLFLFLITSQLEVYALVMLFALIHELGHLLCGVLLGFEAESLKIMPLGFSIEFKTNVNDYNKRILKSNILTLKKMFINIAGPLINVIVIIIGIMMNISGNIIYANIVILIINLIPIYPLDGGRILKNSLKLLIGNQKAQYYSNHISNIFVIAVTAISSITIYYYKNIAILFALMFIWALNIKENKRYHTYNKIYKVIDKDNYYI